MRVTLPELRAITQRLFDHLEAQGTKVVELPADYYWDISKAGRYDPYQRPSELNLGQLTDDWRELTMILEGDKEPIAYALVWLAAILRAVGEEVVS
jgi:hypothetical protein